MIALLRLIVAADSPTVASTLLHLVDNELTVHADHQLVALVTVDRELAAKAKGVVPVAPFEALMAGN